MHPYELRDFLAKVGQEGLERMNRELQTESWTVERWVAAIAVAANERRFCDYWHLPTEADRAMMIRAAKLKYHTLAFWVAVVVAVVTLILLIIVTIEVRDLAKSVTPGEARQSGSRAGGAGPRGPRSR
jgi:heme exporter protein D